MMDDTILCICPLALNNKYCISNVNFFPVHRFNYLFNLNGRKSQIVVMTISNIIRNWCLTYFAYLYYKLTMIFYLFCIFEIGEFCRVDYVFVCVKRTERVMERLSTIPYLLHDCTLSLSDVFI
jgi:hypothetical protein